MKLPFANCSFWSAPAERSGDGAFANAEDWRGNKNARPHESGVALCFPPQSKTPAPIPCLSNFTVRLENVQPIRPSSFVLRHLKSRAFTLVEIMVAVMVFSMVIAAIYATWALIMRATQVGQDAAEQAQRQRVVLRAIGDAVRGVASFQASPQLYGFVLQNGQDPVLSFVSHLPDTYPRNDKFVGETAVRDADGNVHPLDASLRRVTFSLAAGPDGEKNLVLRQNLTLMDMDQDEQQYPLVLAKNVKEFDVEWWGTNEMGKVGWFTEWDDTQTNTIPQMLRVHLDLGANTDQGNKAPDFFATRIYAVPSQMMPAFVQHGVGPGPGGLRPGLTAPPPGGQGGGVQPRL